MSHCIQMLNSIFLSFSHVLSLVLRRQLMVLDLRNEFEGQAELVFDYRVM